MGRGIIYLITNKENGYKYVGQTTLAMNKKWKEHLEEMRVSITPLHRAMKKYGSESFMIKEIDECDETLLNEKEEYWIKYYNTFQNEQGYNPVIRQEIKTETSVEEIIVQSPSSKKKKPWGTFTEKNRGNGKHFGLKIRGKNLQTGKVKDYENAREAAFEITGHKNRNGNILLAARKGGTAYGHRWLILEDKKKKKAVFGVNKKTEQIEVRFESIAAAIRAFKGESNGSNIRVSIKNPGRYSWRGYYWFLDR